MISLNYRKTISFFEENSEISNILLESLNVKKFEDLNKKILIKKEAQDILIRLKSCINKKLDDKTQIRLVKHIDVQFDGRKIVLNVLNKYHKEAFFMIKTYNLIEQFIINGTDFLTIELVEKEKYG